MDYFNSMNNFSILFVSSFIIFITYFSIKINNLNSKILLNDILINGKLSQIKYDVNDRLSLMVRQLESMQHNCVN